MSEVHLKKQKPVPVDDATKAAVEAAQTQARLGKTVSMEQAKENARKRYRASCERRKPLSKCASLN